MGQTTLTIHGEAFHINGRPTYEGRYWKGQKVEGLLFNSRMVQGIFDDLNPDTRSYWAYPDTGDWDAERNTREFVEAMPSWRAHGVLAFTLDLQGGNPRGYRGQQPWHNSAITPDGSLRPDYMARLQQILDRADRLGMVVILGLFYFGQDQRLRDEEAVERAVDATVDWLLERDYRHVLIEVANECDNRKYDCEILKPERAHELILRVRQRSAGRLLVSTSCCGGRLPDANVVQVADFILIHGNGVSDPARIGEMVRQVRAMPDYRPMPILFNEDDHFDFDRPQNNMLAALGEYASWGYLDIGEGNYEDGYQSVPTDWRINTPLKRAFFASVRDITGTED